MQGGRVQFAWLGRRDTGKPGLRRARLMSGFFRAAFEQTNDAMLAVGGDGCILDANRAACELFERTREQMLHSKIGDRVRSGGAPEAPSESGEFPAISNREAIFARADGSECAVDVTLRSDIAPDVHLLVMRDRSELRTSHAHLLRADRLSTLGMLAVGVAHEINNPLMYAMTNLRSALRRIPELTARAREAALEELEASLEQIRRMLATADEGMDRVGTLVRDLRLSSHESELRERVDLRSILESCLNIAHGEIRQRARVVREYAEIAGTHGNAGRLGQVFLNLLVNAAQAIPEGRPGEIRVVTRILDGARVAIEVSDNGMGIDPQTLARIFEPFFTTKPAGQGTGLGLYIARAIVSELGGQIEAESTLGRGTTLRIILPQK